MHPVSVEHDDAEEPTPIEIGMHACPGRLVRQPSERRSSAGLPVLRRMRLVASRMLVQANSGGGKSRAIRQLLEETHGRVQHLVLDPEGEFATLREKFDYVLAGKEGDVAATPKTARLLCRRLVELGASAVIDLYELSLHERREFVKLFLVELMALPRALWHPALVVIDEAHLFAPQSGESQATEAVISLCTQGRKRGFCAVLATQRISKLHKDAAAELLNKLIGRTGLDIDVKRAADELGLDKEHRRGLSQLAAGEFYAYGPAIANEIQIVRTGAVVTTHPEAGRLSATPAPPSAKVKAMLAQQLGDLPKEAEEEGRTIAELQRQLRETTTKLKKSEKSGGERTVEKVVIDERAIERAVAAERSQTRRRLSLAVKDIRSVVHRLGGVAGVLDDLTALGAALQTMSETSADSRAEVQVGNQTQGTGANHPADSAVGRSSRAPARPIATPRSSSNGTLPKGEQICLVAIASYDDGVDRDQLSILSGYKRSTRDAYVQRLGEKQYVEVRGQRIVATPDGVDALGSDYQPLPTGVALQAYWLDRLPEGERKILAELLEEYPNAIARDALSDRTGYKRSTRDAYIQRLGTRKLIETAGGGIRARDTLFDVAR